MKQPLGLFFAILLVAIFTLGTSEVAHAQQATGRIIGNVTDPSGAGVPGVQVEAINVATRVSQETKTDREGFFDSAHGLTSLQDINPFILGTTNRVLNLGAGDTSCVDEDGNSSSGVDPASTCSFATLPEFKNVANVNYNGLQASLTRQLTDDRYIGKTYFTLAYTYAHEIDDASGFRQRNSSVPSFDPQLFRASSDQDIRAPDYVQRRVGPAFRSDVEFRTEAIDSGLERISDRHLAHGISVRYFRAAWRPLQSRLRRSIGRGSPTNVHANIAGPTNTFNPSNPQTINGTTGNFYFNPNSFTTTQCGDSNNPIATCVPSATIFPSNAQVVANPALATYGTLPRNFLRGPGYINIDMAFSKTTAITERVKLEFRTEFFNLSNHVNFLNPGVNNNNDGTFSGAATGNNPNSGQFGQITSTYDPRIIQLALRLAF